MAGGLPRRRAWAPYVILRIERLLPPLLRAARFASIARVVGRRAKSSERAPARPRPLTALVGRDALVGQIAEALRAGDRCVTLTGAPGIGKTRVADAVAERVGDVAWWDLGGLAGDTARARVTAALAGSERRLVVFDGADGVASELGVTIAGALARSQAATLVTSSVPLGIPGERLVEVPPLALPAVGEAPLASASGALLAARAAERAVHVGSNAEEAAVWTGILALLDGHPRAIELTAAPLALLGAEACLDALATRMLDVLAPADGAGGLREAFAPLLARLSAADRDIFAACAVFHGPFDRDAFAFIAAAKGLEARGDLLAVLARLRNASLVRALHEKGAPRFLLLGPLRALAAEQLETRPFAKEVTERHARYFAELGDDLALRVQTNEDGAARQRLAACEADLAAIARRAFVSRASLPAPSRTSEDVPLELGTKALLALEPLALRRGPFDAYAELLARAADRLEGARSAELRTRVTVARARTALARGTLPESAELFARARDEARAVDRADLEGMCLTRLGVLASYLRGEGEAARFFEAARRALARCDVPYLEGNLLGDRASAESRAGREEEAVALRIRAIGLYQRAGHVRRAAVTRGYLGTSYLQLGRTWEARAALIDALSELGESDDRRTECQLRGYLGSALLALGEVEEARASLETAVLGHRALGDRWSEAYATGALGDVAFAAADARSAVKDYRLALAQFAALAEPAYAAIYGASLAAAEVALGRAEEAEAHLEEARARALEGRVPTAKACVELFGALLDVAGAARERGGKRAKLHERAERCLAHHADPRRVRPPTHHELFAARVLARSLAAADGAAARRSVPARGRRSPLPLAGEQRSRIRVGPDTCWIQVDGATPVDLSRRKPARLLLAALIAAHRSTPGTPVTRDALFAAAWPGQGRTRHESAMNRVYVNLVRLREIGLRDLVFSRDDGVLLDPGVKIEA